MPHLPWNQTPHPPAAFVVPEVQSITDRTQDMTVKYQEISEIIGLIKGTYKQGDTSENCTNLLINMI